ncbi:MULTISPECIES: 16S rRNA (cytidine(1402)-2'-O)-methyltransferase [Gracilimonas]|uniref:Ribosomal RNA small subunit methyltransferase I n=1 Tax=Gracilimonas sediminicola TaxID=2952158 RepID=A0A9X2L530_9BACT|nr:16S rRNA (cytidine(1402)-2'-O)-methyltransferase [Gracilimonas sediminicola]
MSTLYIVATPIGNLQDFSPRAVEVLQSVDYIACEDTRTSGHLLQRFQIDKPTFSFHQHNEHRKVGHLMNILDAQQDVALISDAGMPGISDPGFLAVRAAQNGNHTVSVIPGPDAATTAVVASGLPCDRYIFEGFLPHKKGRQKRLGQLAEEELTIIIYESPNRLLKLLGELEEHFEPDRLAAVARELTKKFEEVVRGTISELKTEFESRDSIKGEIVVIVSGKGYSE